MKLSLALVAVTVTPSTAFTASSRVGSAIGRGSLLFATVEPPLREAPSAGWVPEWEDREGLTPEEFLQSDMSKPDLSGMWECPLTRWDTEGYVERVFYG
jgi:hypothetical protein